MIEFISAIATVFAVGGVILNNERDKIGVKWARYCFVAWGVSNLMSFCVHVHASLWSLAVRDAIFWLLAIRGLFAWKKP